MNEKTNEQVEKEFRLAMCAITNFPVEHGREICVTPFEGNYGKAGYVIAINGSPPRGILIVQKDYSSNSGMTIISDSEGKSKMIRDPIYGYGYGRSSKGKAARLWNAAIELLKFYQ
jgi:hypothetical protein